MSHELLFWKKIKWRSIFCLLTTSCLACPFWQTDQPPCTCFLQYSASSLAQKNIACRDVNSSLTSRPRKQNTASLVRICAHKIASSTTPLVSLVIGQIGHQKSILLWDWSVGDRTLYYLEEAAQTCLDFLTANCAWQLPEGIMVSLKFLCLLPM